MEDKEITSRRRRDPGENWTQAWLSEPVADRRAPKELTQHEAFRSHHEQDLVPPPSLFPAEIRCLHPCVPCWASVCPFLSQDHGERLAVRESTGLHPDTGLVLGRHTGSSPLGKARERFMYMVKTCMDAWEARGGRHERTASCPPSLLYPPASLTDGRA